jgi:hypothetical protein
MIAKVFYCLLYIQYLQAESEIAFPQRKFLVPSCEFCASFLFTAGETLERWIRAYEVLRTDAKGNGATWSDLASALMRSPMCLNNRCVVSLDLNCSVWDKIHARNLLFSILLGVERVSLGIKRAS